MAAQYLLPSDCDAKLVALLAYWRSITPADACLPGRQHFDPAKIPQLLSALWLLDVFHAPLRLRYRLISAAHVEVTGTDRTGMWYDEAHPAWQSSPLYAGLVEAAEGRPAFHRGTPTIHVDKDFLLLETLLLPMARDGRTVDIILAGTVYLRPPAAS